ncbi:MAG TPA: energy transducer TonB [Pyrinomonadaceae bacterium]|nr:energy transducer TonB [Pyrinomonadaceae bacterium]
MNIAHSTDRPSYEYQPTIIETRPLISRLAIQIEFFRGELKRSWPEFKKDPVACTKAMTRELLHGFRSSPNAMPATLAAVAAITCVIVMVMLIDKSTRGTGPALIEEQPEIVFMDLKNPLEPGNNSIGLDGPGRVGFRSGTGEGSGPSEKLAQGGGGGGNRTPLPPQSGELPPPSNIQAAIPTTPPVHAPALPVAGMDIDPALWKDLKAPVFGDPRSASQVESKGSGEGEGIGTNKGLGVGDGSGPGYGPGRDGNMGGGPRGLGCCGEGGGNIGDGNGVDEPYRAAQVEQRARLLSKPEPQYTEEARKNAVSGTVVLRAVFASSGEVVHIRALRTLPFGLTERAIAAARQIQFVPAVKGGHPVSVAMQLEYNFNLY